MWTCSSAKGVWSVYPRHPREEEVFLSKKLHPLFALGSLVAYAIPCRDPVLHEGSRRYLGPIAGYFVGSIKCS
jgi:hypothetical protein